MNKEILKQIQSTGKTLRVLYVEDNAEAREQTLKLLENFFTDITTAADGQEGWEAFQKGSFDLILTDINMPRMNGLDMLEKIRQADSDITCIIITAHDDMHYFTRSIMLGIDGYLLKPIDMSPFLQLLKKSVEKIALQKERDNYHRLLEAKIKERTQALQKRLLIDDLTQINSRHALLQELSANKGKAQTLILLNIDGFTIYNELYGMEVGNDILIAFAHKLDTFAKGQQFACYRISGDEFVLYRLLDTKEGCVCDKTVDMLLNLLEREPLFIESINEEIAISITAGFTCSAANPLGEADTAMKHAKKSGKKYVLYNKELMDNRSNLEKTLYWRREIKQALLENRVIPFFQPIVDRDQQIVKYEALMRIKQYDTNNQLKIISPFEFLEIAIKTRLYDELSYRTIQTAIDIMKNKNISLSLNINLSDINSPELLEMLKKNIRTFNHFNHENPQHHIILEVLENDNIEHYHQVNQQLSQFKNLAVKIAIDDFGSGYSNFSHIIGISPHYLKIDGSLIRDIDTNPKSYEMVRAIVQFARSLGIKTIAEFVSSREIFEITYELGIDEFQGYYFGKPMSIEEIEAMETADIAL